MTTPMRVSTTVLEAFRRFSREEWMSEGEILATIRGEIPKNDKMRIGTAYGNIVRWPREFAEGGGFYGLDGIRFTDRAVDEMLQRIGRFGVYEAKSYLPFDNDIMIVAKVDHLFGTDISEIKTTLDSFDSDKYMASYQWRFYILAFQAPRVTYQVAELKLVSLKDDREPIIEAYGLRNPIASLRVYPYPNLEADCRNLVNEFRNFVIDYKLDDLLRERQREAERRYA